MAKMYTTAKVNPLTGLATDNNPKKEARQEKRQVRREDKALNKSLNEGIKKQGRGLKQYYKGIPVDETASTPKAKDWTKKSRVGAFIAGTPYAGGKDKGGKKNMNTGGGKSKLCIDKFGQKKQDNACRKPD